MEKGKKNNKKTQKNKEKREKKERGKGDEFCFSIREGKQCLQGTAYPFNACFFSPPIKGTEKRGKNFVFLP